MAERICVRLMNEGKITQEMIKSYIEAYHRAYGDNFDAYAEEILADAYVAMERTEHATKPLRMDVWMETGQWTKKTGSARAPPVRAIFNQICQHKIFCCGADRAANRTAGAAGTRDGKSYKDVLPRKAAEYVRRLENKLVYELADSLSVPNYIWGIVGL